MAESGQCPEFGRDSATQVIPVEPELLQGWQLSEPRRNRAGQVVVGKNQILQKG